jgi:serine/threonine protein kinase
LVLEYAPGGDLEDFFTRFTKSGETLPRDVAFRIMRELAEGLKQIRAHGVYHGDLHGKNILLMGDPLTWKSTKPLVKLADFGLAQTSYDSNEYDSNDIKEIITSIIMVAELTKDDDILKALSFTTMWKSQPFMDHDGIEKCFISNKIKA